jgi:uncharacterized cupin superfamily protein
MQRTVVPGVALWSQWQPERNLFFNSFFIEHADGNLIVDPLPLGEADAAEIAERGGAAWVVVTNRDHERAAREVARALGARIAASAGDAPLLTGPVDLALADGDRIGDARAVSLEGQKTAGEIALHFPARRTVLVGDALWGDPAGSLRLMPDAKLTDPPRAVLSLRRLAALRPEHLLVGDGACIFGGATRALWAALEARPDVYVNRIHRDDLVWRRFDGDPAPYGGELAEIGHVVGAERLGYQLTRLDPGTAFCPLHWHAAEEELFVVLSGTPRLLTPRGDLDLRPGDYVAFPTRASGAHKLTNPGPEPCEVLMVANVDPADICYYPDSRKFVIEATDLMVRDHPLLDYYDGE